mgnify:CR=1 FL=1
MAIISNATTIADAGSFSVGIGDMIHIKTLTASSSANLTFLHGTSSVVLDSTYPIYKFEFINLHAATDNKDLLVKFRDGGTNYDATCTTTMFSSRSNEADDDAALGYEASQDEAQQTGGVKLSVGLGTGNDESTSGELLLFNPSSTTFVKHFVSTFPVIHHAEYNYNWYKGGYANVTAAIDGVQFVMSSGNIDAGTIKLYGIKDS